MDRTLKLWLLGCSALGAGQVVPAFAQDRVAPAPEASQSPGDIVVTARRSEERLQDVPISIAVFNQEQLTNRNIVSAADLGTYTPSLSANSRFGSETSTFAIRGFVQEAQTTPSVAVYFADVVAPRAQGGTTGGNGAGVGQFFDLQNVQVLRGPQGTLFGRNTTGGAVLLVPQRPTDQLEGYLEASIGNDNMYRVQGVLNVPLGDRARFRIGVDRQQRDGYLHNRSGIGPEDFNDVDYWSVRASLVVDLTPALESYTVASYSTSNTNGFLPRIVITNTGPGCTPSPTALGAGQILGPLACAQLARQTARGDGFYDVENGNPAAGQDINQWQVINTTSWRASDTLTLRNIVSYAQFTQAQTANIFGDNLTFPFPPPNGSPFVFSNLIADNGRDNIAQWTFTEEFQIQGRTADDRLTYQAGAYYEHSGPIGDYQGSLSSTLISCTNVSTYQCTDVLRIATQLGTGFDPGPIGFVQNSLTTYEFENIGFYAQATYRLTDQLALTGGVRYTIDAVDAVGATRTITFPLPNTPIFTCAAPPFGRPATNPDVCALTASQRSEEPTWLINLDWHPVEDVLLYAKWARGYRQGNANVSNTFPVVWQPESVDSYEVGVKWTLRGPVSGYFNVAAFYNDLSNQQLSGNLVPDGTIPTAAPAQTIVNAGQSRIQGIEVDASLNLFRGFNLTVGYTYLDTELKSYTPLDLPGYFPTTSGSVVGGALSQSPEHRLSVTARYTLPLDQSVGRITLGATYTYTADQIAQSDSPIGTLPSTELINLNLNWSGIAGSPFDLSLFVTNLTDEEYPVFVGGIYNAAGFDTYIVGQPRMFGARIRYSFGG